MARYALLVGVSRCLSGGGTLSGPPNDVAVMKERFESYEAVLPQDETRQGILDALAELRRKASGGADHAVLFFYAGHGTTVLRPDDGGNTVVHEALCPADFRREDDRAAIIDDELVAILRGFASNVEVTAILDCCYAGGVPPTENATQPTRRLWDRIVDRLELRLLGGTRFIEPLIDPTLDPGVIARWKYRGFERAMSLVPPGGRVPEIVVFSACRANQLARERAYKIGTGLDMKVRHHGVFTRHLADVLAAGPQASRTDADVHRDVREAMRANRTGQNPMLFPSGSSRTFPQ